MDKFTGIVEVLCEILFSTATQTYMYNVVFKLWCGEIGEGIVETRKLVPNDLFKDPSPSTPKRKVFLYCHMYCVIM